MILAQTIVTERHAFELAGLPTGWMAFLGLVAVAASCYAVIWLYRRESRAGSTGRLRFFLGCLRGVVVLSLAAIALEPVIAVYRQSTRQGRVAVLYDASGSMEIREAPESGDGTGGARQTRSEQVRRLLAGNEYEWLRKLGAHNLVSVFAFGEGVKEFEIPLQRDVQNPVRNPASGPTLVAPGSLASRTDLGSAVTYVLDELAGSPLAGVVVLSDGAVNRGPDAEAIASMVKTSKTNVYAVGIGGTREPENARVSRLSGPTTASLNDPFEIAVDVAATGDHELGAGVELRRIAVDETPSAASAPARFGLDDDLTPSSRESGELVATQRITLVPGAAPTTLKFQVTPKSVGEFRYVAMIPPDVEDANVDDNVREIVVRISDDQYRVLIVAGRPSFEYRFLTALLERDKSVNVSVWLQSADEQAVREGDTIISELPRRPEDVFAYDAILLLDPFAGDFDSAWAATLRRYVEDFRGGVLLQAGPHFSSRLLRDERLSELVSILPIVPDEEADVRLTEEGTYRTTAGQFTLPEEVRGHPLLALHSDPAVSARIWLALPGAYWHLPVTRAKPIATTLLTTAARPGSGGRAAEVLLAVQPVGGGRTAFLGFDETWRWRATAEAQFTRFWVQMVRYLAQGRREQANRRGTITLDRDVVSLGDFVGIEARVLDPDFVPWFEPTIDLNIGAGEQRSVLKLNAIPDRPGWFAGRWHFEQPGVATLSLTLPGAEPQVVEKVVRVQQPDFEMRTLRQNEEFLRELATRTGGQYLTLEEAVSLPDRIKDATQTSVVRDPQPRALWDEPWVLGALAGLLALEWTLRRRNHLL